MNSRNSKTNVSLEFLYARLDQVRMSPAERDKAKAQLARAEAVVEFVFAIGEGASRLLQKRLLRPVRRMAATFG